MATVQCVVLEREAEALDAPPYPGELGQRIVESVSKEGWTQWLERLVLIINENQLSSADPENLDHIEQHMVGFLFGEGDLGDVELHGDGSKLGYNPSPRGHDGVEGVNLIFGHRVARDYGKAWHGQASLVSGCFADTTSGVSPRQLKGFR